MKYLDSKKFSDSQFKRYKGMSLLIFSQMVQDMQMQILSKGRSPELYLEDQVYSA